MALNDIKEITIPEGSVKKIEDSNGNIIWGSQATFPYRRLEYIHFAGVDEYLNPYIGTKSGYYRSLQFDLERKNVRQISMGLYDTSNSNPDTLARFYVLDFQANTYGARGACGSTWSSNFDIANIPLNTKMRCSVVNSTVSSKPRMVFNLVNISDINNPIYIIGNTTLNGTVNGTIPSTYAYLMAVHTKTANRDVAETFAKGKIYYFEERQNNYQGNLIKQCYPVQRKSDGVCGLYNVIKGAFYPMIGTTITDGAAGPVVDEYWDLTTPS